MRRKNRISRLRDMLDESQLFEKIDYGFFVLTGLCLLSFFIAMPFLHRSSGLMKDLPMYAVGAVVAWFFVEMIIGLIQIISSAFNDHSA